MKKLLCLLSAVLLVFTSCSKDDDNDSLNPIFSILLKTRINIDEDGVSYPAEHVYNGNKIVSITDADSSIMKFTYTGNLITKIESITKNGDLDSFTDYSYISDKLSTSVRKVTTEDTYHKTKFIHNSDGAISYQEFLIDSKTGVESEEGTVGKLTFKDGNLIKDEYSYKDLSQTTYTYEYDNKNYPIKNVLGYNLLDEDSSVNNVVKKTQTNGSGDNINTYVTTYDYKYDENGYPLEKVANFPNGDSVSKETTKYVY